MWEVWLWWLLFLLVVAALVLAALTLSSSSRRRRRDAAKRARLGDRVGGVCTVTESMFGEGVPAGTRFSLAAQCPTGTVLLSGGAALLETGSFVGSQTVALYASAPTGGSAWLGTAVVLSGPADVGIRVCATCAALTSHTHY